MQSLEVKMIQTSNCAWDCVIWTSKMAGISGRFNGDFLNRKSQSYWSYKTIGHSCILDISTSSDIAVVPQLSCLLFDQCVEVAAAHFAQDVSLLMSIDPLYTALVLSEWGGTCSGYHFSGRVYITLGYPQTRSSSILLRLPYCHLFTLHTAANIFTNRGSSDFDDKGFLYKRVFFVAVILSAAGWTPATYVWVWHDRFANRSTQRWGNRLDAHVGAICCYCRRCAADVHKKDVKHDGGDIWRKKVRWSVR